MTRNFADKAALLVEIHSLEIRLVAGEDLVGFGDNPDLQRSQQSAHVQCP